MERKSEEKQGGRIHRPLVSSGSRDCDPRGCAGPSGGAAGRDRRLNISRVSSSRSITLLVTWNAEGAKSLEIGARRSPGTTVP